MIRNWVQRLNPVPGVWLVPFAAVALAAAATLPAQDIPARDLVNLEMVIPARNGCGPQKLDFARLAPDGTRDSESFRVPEGRVLVVTDVDWYYAGGAPGYVVLLSLLVENLADADKRHRAFESTIRLGADGVGGASEHMTTGFAVTPDARLCLELRNAPIGDPLRLSKVLLRGYLAIAQ